MRNITDISIGVTVVALSGLAYWSGMSTSNIAGTTDPLGPLAFPRAIILLMFVAGCAQIVIGLRAKVPKTYWPEMIYLAKIGSFILLFCLYVALVMWSSDILDLLQIEGLPSGSGFTMSTFIYLVLSLYLCGRRNPLEIFLVAILVPTAISVLFVQFFQLVLP